MGDKKVEENIINIIKDEIYPLVSRDGGDIEFVSFDEKKGIVKVKLQGACAHCPMANVTLKYTVEQIMKDRVKEVKGVENIQ